VSDYEALLRGLVQQIESNDFTDSLGHQAKMLKAFQDAKRALSSPSEREGTVDAPIR